MAINNFLTFFSILFIATIVSGPSMLMALNHGANLGFKKALNSALGYMLGNLLMAIVSFLGLGLILIASGIVFNIIKWIGIMYLVYIGIKMIMQPVGENNENDNPKNTKVAQRNGLRLFIDGLMVSIGNPKGILFFSAIFPQFINIKHTSANEIMLVFTTLGIVISVCYMAYAFFGEKLTRLFRLEAFRKYFNRISGSLMIGLGLSLAFTKKL